jgi:hypothetical protein
MNLPIKNRFALVGVAVFCVAASSQAMTLGRARGAVFLGQPLRLSIPIQLEPGEKVSAPCFEAEVFYGDARQDVGQVTVSTDHSPQSQLGNVYVTSLSHVDEPVVSVYLRAGCESKSTRRYVLLADLASEVVQSVSRPVEIQPTVPSVVAPKGRLASNDRGAESTQAVSLRNVRPEVASMGVASALSSPKATPIRRARLKLLPIDLTPERDPTLKLSGELYVGGGENLQKRAEAVALWRSLNATPQDILAADSRRQSMESDLQGLQVATGKNQQALKQLADRLENAESQRYANPLVYGLFAILLACGFGLAYLLFRLRQGGLGTSPWWGAQKFSDEPVLPQVDSSGQRPRTVNEPKSVQEAHEVTRAIDLPLAGESAALTQVDIDLHLDEPVLPVQPKVAGEASNGSQIAEGGASQRSSGHADFAHSMTTSLRAVNIKEMLDVRQQAEFFMTLGQHDEALGLLKGCVDDSSESNPLVYLDLLKILHTLGRKSEFDRYRTDFNALFSGHVPAYEAFSQEGSGLEAYPDICRTIEASWPSNRAIEFIEKSLVRDFDEDARQAMDLDAFRDLLLLHGVAKRMESSLDTGQMPFITSRPSSVEFVAAIAPGSEVFSLPTGDQPKLLDGMDNGNLSVDLDLSVGDTRGNLIDFDASDFSPPDKGAQRKT